MPIFEFICKGCQASFESLVRGCEEVKCPKCNGSELKKLVSSFAFSSKDSSGKTTSSSSGCSGCSGGNCSSCAR